MQSSAADQTAKLLKLVDALVAELRPGATLKARLDSRLDKDLGLDSLARVELLARIEAAFDVRLPEDLLGSAETVRDLLASIAGAGASATEILFHDRQLAVAAIDADLPHEATTLVDVLHWHAQRHPERTHVLFQRSARETVEFTYAELLATARQVAAGLRGRGVRAGDFVALMLPTGLEFFQSFYGILLAGAVPVPIYPPTRPGQIEDHLRRQAGILQNCEAVALLSFDAARLVAHILSGLVPSLRTVTTPEELRREGAGASAANDHRGMAKRDRLPAIHLGLDGQPQGGDAGPRQPVGEYPCLGAGGGAQAGRCGGELVAAVSRHGLDRGLAGQPVPRLSAGLDVAAGFSRPSGALVVGDPRASRYGDGGAEFCIRAVPASCRSPAFAGPGPFFLALRCEWRGAGRCRYSCALCRRLPALWVSRRGPDSGLWPGGMLGRIGGRAARSRAGDRPCATRGACYRRGSPCGCRR
jgi:acyl carrier protein